MKRTMALEGIPGGGYDIDAKITKNQDDWSEAHTADRIKKEVKSILGFDLI